MWLPRIVASLSLFVAVGSAAADLRLERTRTRQWLDSKGEVSSSKQRDEVVFVGVGSARLDSDAASAIIRAKDGVFLWLDHEAKAYAEVPLPLRLEDLLTDEEKACLRQVPWVLDNADASVTMTDEYRIIDHRKTTRLKVRGHLEEFEFERDSWVTHDLSVDLGPYLQLVQNLAALTTLRRGWIGEVVAAGGYPVESTETRRMRGRVRLVKQRLKKVVEVPADRNRFLPPPGYSPTLGRPPIDLKCESAPRP